MILNPLLFLVRIGAFAKRVGDSANRMMRFVDYMERCKDNAINKQKKMK